MQNESEVDVIPTEIDNEVTEVFEEKPEVVAPPVETPEAKIARLKRQLKKAQQQAGVEEAIEPKTDRKPFVLGYAEKAYLNANGVKGTDEYNLVSEMVANTGKDIESLLDNKYFQAELKELRATRESKNASDALSGNNRTGQSSRDSVDYWIAKGELPPPYMQKLRREVVNARIVTEKNGSTFSNNPVVGK